MGLSCVNILDLNITEDEAALLSSYNSLDTDSANYLRFTVYVWQLEGVGDFDLVLVAILLLLY